MILNNRDNNNVLIKSSDKKSYRYYYRVSEGNYFKNETDFAKGNLLSLRKDAIRFYHSRMKELMKNLTSSGNHTSLSRTELVELTLKRYLLKVCLVEKIEDYETNYCIGGAEKEVIKGREKETEVFKEIGLIIDYDDLII